MNPVEITVRLAPSPVLPSGSFAVGELAFPRVRRFDEAVFAGVGTRYAERYYRRDVF
ncbi:hypothetical protein ACFQGT_13815 [Natrialbaceae archaeon GCM10025810]|uniref:hypothetical protein n=1 Tax=Halovalidus salilacus TaxID=3075124 RepID=UPI003609C3F5